MVTSSVCYWMFISITEYMLKTREERTIHLKLDESCVERGGTSTDFRGLLAFVLGTSIPKGMKVHCCHACHNSKCSNPNHMYWGTPSENKIDADKVYRKTFWQRVVDKYGEQGAREMFKVAALKGAATKKLRRAEAEGPLSES